MLLLTKLRLFFPREELSTEFTNKSPFLVSCEFVDRFAAPPLDVRKGSAFPLLA
jgi:hypothetical protein